MGTLFDKSLLRENDILDKVESYSATTGSTTEHDLEVSLEYQAP